MSMGSNPHYQIQKDRTTNCVGNSIFLVVVTGYSLASQALPACCHFAWHKADNYAPLGYGTIHRIVPLNASCPLRVQIPFVSLN